MVPDGRTDGRNGRTDGAKTISLRPSRDNNGLDERPNDAYNWQGATLFLITTMHFN